MSFVCSHPSLFFFLFNDPATTEIYTLSLHDALPISWAGCQRPWTLSYVTANGNVLPCCISPWVAREHVAVGGHVADRKSTRLNSSHGSISYAVFCLKKKKKKHTRS